MTRGCRRQGPVLYTAMVLRWVANEGNCRTDSASVELINIIKPVGRLQVDLAGYLQLLVDGVRRPHSCPCSPLDQLAYGPCVVEHQHVQYREARLKPGVKLLVFAQAWLNEMQPDPFVRKFFLAVEVAATGWIEVTLACSRLQISNPRSDPDSRSLPYIDDDTMNCVSRPAYRRRRRTCRRTRPAGNNRSTEINRAA